ncbi:MAG: formylmethanofuran--tetrahydromethanopterin N-formyltransferase [Candidatus Bathyarchaeia archaeon]
MSRNETASKSTENASELKVVERGDGYFKVQHRSNGNICTIMDTFAEMFPMWLGRILITAESSKWALTAARAATGFATSIIGSPAECGIERAVGPKKTPDGRTGVVIQVYQRLRRELRSQMLSRIGQCVLTCPTTAAFDALERSPRRVKVGKSLRYFGDGFERRDVVGGRVVWRIPVMDGEFVVEERFGVRRGVAGGNLLILAEGGDDGLKAAEEAAKAIRRVVGVILPFPGGVCRSGTKVGSMKYKLPASTNHPFCPSLREWVPNSMVPEGVNCVYELVIDGVNLKQVKKAMALGIEAASGVKGVVKITAANYGGRLGPYRAHLKEILDLTPSNSDPKYALG